MGTGGESTLTEGRNTETAGSVGRWRSTTCPCLPAIKEAGWPAAFPTATSAGRPRRWQCSLETAFSFPAPKRLFQNLRLGRRGGRASGPRAVGRRAVAGVQRAL